MKSLLLLQILLAISAVAQTSRREKNFGNPGSLTDVSLKLEPVSSSGLLDSVFQLVRGGVLNRDENGQFEIADVPLAKSSWDICPGSIESKLNVKFPRTVGMSCTAFIYRTAGDKAYLITAGHCIEKLAEVRDARQYKPGSLWITHVASSGRRESMAVDEIGFLDGMDVGFLAVAVSSPSRPLTAGNSSRILSIAHFPLGLTTLAQGRGTIDNQGPAFTDGSDGRLKVNIATFSGSSGAPVLNDQNEVVGLVVKGGQALVPVQSNGGIPSGYCNDIFPGQTEYLSIQYINTHVDNAKKEQTAQEERIKNRATLLDIQKNKIRNKMQPFSKNSPKN